MERKSNSQSIKGIVIALICVFVSFNLYYWAPPARMFSSNGFVVKFLNQMVFVIADIICLVILKKLFVLKFKVKGFVTGFAIAGFWLFQFACIAGLMIYRKTTITGSVVDIVFFALFTLAIGASEEIAFRGILMNAFLDYFGNDSAKAIRLSIICSAILFGLLHLLNAFGPDSSWSAASYQALDCILNGIIFGAIYYRTRKNLWVCIVLHGITDFMAMLSGGVLTGVSQAEGAASSGAAGSAMFLMLTLAIGLWVTRKKKLESVYAE